MKTGPLRCQAAAIDPVARALRLEPIELPAPAAGQVLIEVAAAGVNRADLDQKRGSYAPPPGASPVPGLEVSGTIAQCGPDVRGLRPGQRVMALLTGGGYAEYALAEAALTLPVPERLTFEQAAAVPESYFTVWSNVFMEGRLSRGQVFLVHGGAGGLGSAAVQIAKSMGACVITTARSEDKAAFCRKLGADLAVVYTREDFERAARGFLGERGVDVVLDWIGRAYLNKHLALLGRRGRLILIASRSREGDPIDLGLVMKKELVITGSLLRPRPLHQKRAIADEIDRALLPKLASGELVPAVSHVFPLSQADDAHAVLENGQHKGKVVLRIARLS